MTDSVSRLFDRFSGLKALSIGHVTHDFYGDRILPGGCAFYGARTLRALGAESKLATAVGRDFACREELDGIDVSSQECEETTIFTNLYPKGKPRKISTVRIWCLSPRSWRRWTTKSGAP
jgi:sugar/nucleoside kinase (ribokinase family)